MKKTFRFIAACGFGLSLILGPLSVQAFELQALSKPCCCCPAGHRSDKPCCRLKSGPSWNLLANTAEIVRTVFAPSAGPASFEPQQTGPANHKILAFESPPGPAPNFHSPRTDRSPPTA